MKPTNLIIGMGLFMPELAFGQTAPAGKPQLPQFRFVAYDRDPAKTDPKNMTFQINRLDVRHPAHFLKLGDTIEGTAYKLLKFQYKTRTHPRYGEEDASELTLLNTATKETLVLTLPPIVHGVAKPK